MPISRALFRRMNTHYAIAFVMPMILFSPFESFKNSFHAMPAAKSFIFTFTQAVHYAVDIDAARHAIFGTPGMRAQWPLSSRAQQLAPEAMLFPVPPHGRINMSERAGIYFMPTLLRGADASPGIMILPRADKSCFRRR